MADSVSQAGWTRDLARDVFPGQVPPFAWSALAAPAERALRRALVALGAPEPGPAALWRRADENRVYVAGAALTEAAEKLCGAAWWLPERPVAPGGLLARLQMAGVIRRSQAAIAATMAATPAHHEHVTRWLAWVRGLQWTQADLLQVMEELEPQAQTALQTYFVLRAGLNAAHAQVADRLAEWLPDVAPASVWGLYVGLEDLPTVQAAHALAAATGDAAVDARARYGHRGPGEIRADATRWADNATLHDHLTSTPVTHTAEAAQQQRQATEQRILGALTSGRGQQLRAAVAQARELYRSTDIAWDALTQVLAAAQRWSRAAAAEALAAGLIARPEDVLYLELEELKQVATGEWHRGRSAEVQAAIADRRAARRDVQTSPVNAPAAAGSGRAQGPAYLAAPGTEPPPPGAIWLGETADPGCAAFWLAAGAVVVAAADPWAPGVSAARALGVPVVIGAGHAVAAARPGARVTVDGAAVIMV